jgi:hypothetical protein
MPVYLDELPAHLSRITRERWKDLFDLIPEIEKTVSSIEWNRKHSPGLPSEWAEIVVRLHEYLIGSGLIVDFDWAHWKELEGELEYLVSEESGDLSELPPVTLCKLLTAIVRSDRADDVLIATHFENGTILKILRGLEKYFG